MRKFRALLLTIVAALAVGVLPMLFAVYVAKQSALDAERNRALAYAQDVLVRVEITADQAQAAIDALVAPGVVPCSPANIVQLRRLALRSTNLRAIGYVEGNRMVCSSLGAEVGTLDLGPANVIRSSGLKLRSDVVFPFAPATRFIVIEYKHYAAIVHKGTAFVATTGVAQASLAVVSTPGRQELAVQGYIRPDWTIPLRPGQSVTIVGSGYVVAKAMSQRYQVMAIAAVSTVQLNARVRQVAKELVPIGFGVGMLLVAVVVGFARYRMALPAVIKDGLKRDEFFLVYQPVVDLRTGRWTGAEALLRWRRERDEIVRPDEFIPVAESSGLIMRITERVVQLVRDDAATLLERHPGFHIGINLAPEDLHDQRTIAMLTGLLAAIRAGPGNVVVEATERGFTDPASAAPVIRALRAAGIRIAIDDFGTGYSSLASLQSMEVDYLKIDKAFVDTLGTSAATGTVALHIIEMAKALNLEMIAEGVTNEAQATILRERGVQFAQGYLYAEPMPIDDLLAALHGRAAQAAHHHPA
jgi:sensor c-di-GMP phosphodiesterase-like protein